MLIQRQDFTSCAHSIHAFVRGAHECALEPANANIDPISLQWVVEANQDLNLAGVVRKDDEKPV